MEMKPTLFVGILELIDGWTGDLLQLELLLTCWPLNLTASPTQVVIAIRFVTSLVWNVVGTQFVASLVQIDVAPQLAIVTHCRRFIICLTTWYTPIDKDHELGNLNMNC